MTPAKPNGRVGIVVIGRNEGERLKQCLSRLPASMNVVYVDSGSTDGSIELAEIFGAIAVRLDLTKPFTAARARNVGFAKLKEILPELEYVQFVDGDCVLAEAWTSTATNFLSARSEVAVVCGRRREIHPNASLYNQLCDAEWNTPVGEANSCGGDALIRARAFDDVGGFNACLIAGEEPEMCVRLREAGWKIYRIDADMTYHDANMLHFSQWWRRTIRNGYAYAEGAHLHGSGPFKHWKWEAKRTWVWAFATPIICLLATLILWPFGLLAWMVFPLQIARQVLRNSGDLEFASKQAVFQLLGRFAELIGQIRYFVERSINRRARLIEYK